MKKPPKKLSAVVKLALSDLAKIEKSKDYLVAMSVWHQPNNDGQCRVCFAGAVMAKTCEADPEKLAYPDDAVFGKSWEKAFDALNDIRYGAIWSACMSFGIHQDKYMKIPEVRLNVDSYSNDKKKWRKDMNKIVGLLEKAGL